MFKIESNGPVKNQEDEMYIKQTLLLKRFAVALISLFIATSVLAEDAADDEDAAKDTTSKTEGAAAGSGGNFDPPNDDHANPVPPVAQTVPAWRKRQLTRRPY